MALSLEELKSQLEEALTQSKRNSQLDNQIRSKTIIADELEASIEKKEKRNAELDKEFDIRYTQKLRALEDREAASLERERQTMAEAEAIRIERNALTMEKNVTAGQKEEAARTVKEYGEKWAMIKGYIDALSKI